MTKGQRRALWALILHGREGQDLLDPEVGWALEANAWTELWVVSPKGVEALGVTPDPEWAALWKRAKVLRRDYFEEPDCPQEEAAFVPVEAAEQREWARVREGLLRHKDKRTLWVKQPKRRTAEHAALLAAFRRVRPATRQRWFASLVEYARLWEEEDVSSRAYLARDPSRDMTPEGIARTQAHLRVAITAGEAFLRLPAPVRRAVALPPAEALAYLIENIRPVRRGLSQCTSRELNRGHP